MYNLISVKQFFGRIICLVYNPVTTVDLLPSCECEEIPLSTNAHRSPTFSGRFPGILTPDHAAEPLPRQVRAFARGRVSVEHGCGGGQALRRVQTLRRGLPGGVKYHTVYSRGRAVSRAEPSAGRNDLFLSGLLSDVLIVHGQDILWRNVLDKLLAAT